MNIHENTENIEIYKKTVQKNIEIYGKILKNTECYFKNIEEKIRRLFRKYFDVVCSIIPVVKHVELVIIMSLQPQPPQTDCDRVRARLYTEN